jgi:hypothetical protein
MQGQWLGKIGGDLDGTLRVELEDRGEAYIGCAYVFYALEHQLPGFRFNLTVPKAPPHSITVSPLYLYSAGGIMTDEERRLAEHGISERFGEPMPNSLDVEFTTQGKRLKVTWAAPSGDTESVLLTKSNPEGKSRLTGRTDLIAWDQFREWAVSQKPRKYIFRGQSRPDKLASSFHRTWRKDLATWVAVDVRALFGAILERVSYPLQLGNFDHNAAVWTILQHHGYPTPLLDWTYSPFVAAYFAFEHVKVEQRASPRIFIFDQESWNEKYGRLAFFADAAPAHLTVLESLSIGNPRHGPQQALSTVTNIADVEAFVRERERKDNKIYLTACDLPAGEKPRIMRELELMGITYGSLFPGLDGMCHDMRERHFVKHP